MKPHHRHTPTGHRTLRFERCETRRVLSAQTLDLGSYVAQDSDNTLVFSSGLADGWTSIFTNSQLDTIGQVGETVTLSGAITKADYDLASDAYPSFLRTVATNARFELGDAFFYWLEPTDTAETPVEPPVAIDPIDRGVEYLVTQPEGAVQTPSPLAKGSTEPVFEPSVEESQLDGMPAPTVRPMDRVAMTSPKVSEHAASPGLIDLSALLIEQPPRTHLAATSTEPPATNDASARDAAFAVESWVRALPRAAAPSQAELIDAVDRTTEARRTPPLGTAPLSIDPTEPEATPDDSPRVSALEPTPLDDRGRVVRTAETAAERLDRSSGYRFVATLVSLMTVGGLVRAVRDEPVRRASPAEPGRPRGNGRSTTLGS